MGQWAGKGTSKKFRRGSAPGTARQALVWSMALSSMISTPVLSAQTDISTSPITSTNAAQVKPNIMLLMDTSGSMGWGHMPDEVETQVGIGSIGYKAAQCNVLYYNRNQTYAIPKKADGLQFPTPSFTSARYDPFDTASSTTVDLSSAFKAYDSKTLRTSSSTNYDDTEPPQPAYYYYKTGGTVPITAYNSSPCLDGDVSATVPSSDGGTWTRALVGAASGVGGTDERANFAIWYSYYRTRLLLVKSAASLAFTPLTDSFRVGFITVKPKDNPSDTSINAAKYLAINDFNTTQRGLWFDKLFAQKPGGSSPAREGLARVGRHYAGMQDGINEGMAGDPVQYSCQQNFTIMTTDGYWNAQDESIGLGGGHLGGAVDMTGKSLVGQRDGVLNAFSTNNPSPPPAADVNSTPRPIWDGTFDGLRTITTKTIHHEYQPCGAYYNVFTTQLNQSTSQTLTQTTQTTQSTVQNLQSTIQNLESQQQTLRSTAQQTRSQVQNLASTNQNLQSTTQRLMSTAQTTSSTLQNRQATNQNLQSTVQNLQSGSQTNRIDTRTEQTVRIARQSTAQNLQSTSQNTRSTSQQNRQTVQTRRSTVQNLAATSQTRRSTSQTTQSTVQNLRSTVQNLQSTAQVTQSTTQTTRSTLQVTVSTSQITESTSQLQVTTSQVRRSTSQLRSCDASTELCTPGAVGSCTPGGSITCETVTTGPTLVASCTAAAASASNNWTATTCNTTSTPATPTGSCTSAAASSSNGYTTTSCNTVTTGPTPTASCNAATASSGNNWTGTTCAGLNTGPTPTGSCTPQAASSGNGWTTTTCGANATGPTGVASCTGAAATSANAWTSTTCGTASTSNVPVSSCTPASASSANSWTTTTCGTNNSGSTPVASCTASGPTAANSWTTTTCSTNNTTSVPVSSCSAATATAANSWTTTTCGTNNTTNVPTGSCTASSPTSANNWTTTTCPTVVTGPTPVDPATCTAATGAAGNNWTTTTCPVTNVAPTPVASCSNAAASAANSWTATTCSTNNTTNVPISSCTAATATAANAWTTTTCPNLTSALTPVSSCTTVAASSGNSWTATNCPIVTTGPTGVSSCAPITAASGNNWTATTCAVATTTNVPVASCAPIAAASGNNWTTTTCSTNNTTDVAVASCTASGATAGNGYTTTTCPAETVVSGPTNVSSCTPSAGTSANGYQRTDCQTIAVTTPVQAGTCVGAAASSGNSWVATTCNVVTTANVPVASCTPQTAAAGNNWQQITCGTNNTSNVPVATCTAATASAGNAWTTVTCPAPVTTGPTPVATCTVAAATSANSFTSTSCPAPVTTGPTPVSSCSNIAAASGNSWTATTCATTTTSNVPVASCTNTAASSGNAWTTTTCSNNNTTNVPVASCTPQTAAAANNWTGITCPAPVVTSNVPVGSCSPDGFANAGNSFTTRTCSVNSTLNVPSGTCVAEAASGANNWTTTSCPTILTGPTGVASCTAESASSTNSWTQTTCSSNNTSNVPVAFCAPASPSSANGFATVSCSTNNTTNVPVASCSGGGPTAGNQWTTTNCSNNNTTNVPVSSCTASAATSANGWTTTTCPANTVGPVGSSTCTPSGPTSANGWTTTTCPTPVTTGPTPTASCTATAPSSANSWTRTTCSTATSASTPEATCSAVAASAANNYTATNCVQVSGNQRVSTTSTRVRQFFISGSTLSSNGVDNTTTGSAIVEATCHAPGAEPPLPADAPPAWTTADSGTYPSCSAWPCTVDDNTGTPRSVNSLADVAQYYYVNDLRTAANEPRGIDYYRDDVPGVGSGAEDDRVRWQHMTTFSIALGVSGSLQYRSDYKTAATGDFADIRTGAKNWPLWPDPSPGYYTDPTNYNDPRSIDDFWHAAVNGRGSYFSAGNPTSVIAGLAGALAGINARVASSSGVGASNLEPVAGDNFAYLAGYTTQKWTGDVQAHEINISTGAIESPIIWSAKTLLDASTSVACDNRNIMLFRQGATNNLVNFSWGSKRCDVSGNPTGTADTGLNSTEQAHFSSANVSLLSQHPSMTDGVSGPDQRTPAAGANLVNFLRGQRGLEDFTATDAAKLYRKRESVLGDTVNGQPVYVRSPFASFADAGYASFKAAHSGRVPMLYVPANDGMLHAFYAGSSISDPQGGKEAWAVIPSTVLPKLYKLADNNYKNLHEYFVDATPTVADAYVGSTWRTMLVGGLNGGGRGFYALDVTDPASPKGMWEFKWSDTCYDTAIPSTANADCHIGLSFGKPLITKLADGRWVVMVTSGYNNVNASAKTGDGLGYLYVLNAATGEIIYKIATTAGDATTPSGLAQVNNFVEKADIDNTTVRVYGTDLLGNIWRFDVNDSTAPSGREATLVGTAKDALGTPQPITVRPELTKVGDQPMLFVATGKLLGATDVTDLQVQSIYGIVDPVIGTTAFTNLRTALAPLTMTQSGSGTGATRTIACTGTALQCSTTDGWRIDLPDTGERVNVEMKLRAGTLIIGSNVPQISACSAGGYSWLNYLSYKTGLAVTGSAGLTVSEQVANSLIVGLTVIKVGSTTKAIVSTSDGGVLARTIPTNHDQGTAKRVSWREVLTQ